MKRTRFALAACFWLLACGGPLEYRVPSSPSAPGADAHIVADVREDEQQTQLNVDIVNLPPPERVDQAARQYVAWYRKDSGQIWSRIAVLAYQPDTREASLVSAVPATNFELEITAEAGPDVGSPSPTVVFSQLVEKTD